MKQRKLRAITIAIVIIGKVITFERKQSRKEGKNRYQNEAKKIKSNSFTRINNPILLSQ